MDAVKRSVKEEEADEQKENRKNIKNTETKIS